jgi:uncharacterized protein (DUF433 family)
VVCQECEGILVPCCTEGAGFSAVQYDFLCFGGEKAVSVDIGSLIVSSPDMKHGRPCIAGTGTTVHRITIWYKLGYSPEEMVRKYPHLTLAQVHAALAYYHANQAEIEAGIAADEAEYERLEREYWKTKQPA